MKKITHTFSILSTSIIGLALSLSFVEAHDLDRVNAQRYQRAQETQKIAEEDKEKFNKWTTTNIEIISKIFTAAKNLHELRVNGEKRAYETIGGYDLALYGNPNRDEMEKRKHQINEAIKEYGGFLKGLQSVKADSVAFQKLYKHISENNNYLINIQNSSWPDPDYEKLTSLKTQQIAIEGSNENTYYLYVIEVPTQQ
ncbi:hypothetical protein [Candidatus Odyssella thessalonicensis]|uniref:hypothetical protein n=1 Tax=Candidatus Odyssella thessalonicensis TaxID=84647 RepID=UPI000225AF80|nr:hypothetical protein [Candidatus Odyssella thessalonicensis]